MAQVINHVCAGFAKGRTGVCGNCGHPKLRHVEVPLNGAGFCKECVRLWRTLQEETAWRTRYY
jgi:hypothetical protein